MRLALHHPHFVSGLIVFHARQCIVVLLLFVCGCTGNRLGNVAGNIATRVVAQPNSDVQLLESELRWMEDNLYQMDDQLDRCLEQLESARRDNAVLRFELAEARKQDVRKTGSPTLAPPRGSESGSGDSSDSEGPFDEETEDLLDEDLLGPDIQFGATDDELKSKNESLSEDSDGDKADDSNEDGGGEAEEMPAPAVRNPLDLPSDDDIKVEGFPEPEPNTAPNVDPGAAPEKPGNPFESDDVSVDPDVVSRIKLNRQLTGGYSFDKQPGHEGVMVVIEPQNAYAQFVPKPGHVVVEVRDPTKPGLAGRVAKWKFDVSETQAKMKKTLMGKGIHLQLPWPSAAPQNKELNLIVEYEADGRRLRTAKRMLVKPTTSALISKAEAAEAEWSPSRPTQRIPNRIPATATNSPALEWQPTR